MTNFGVSMRHTTSDFSLHVAIALVEDNHETIWQESCADMSHRLSSQRNLTSGVVRQWLRTRNEAKKHVQRRK